MPFNVWSLTEEKWMLLKSVRSRAGAVDAMTTIFQREKPDHKFEVRRTFPVLEQHGTPLMRFKPQMVWKMAMEDLDRHDLNRTQSVNACVQYHFHRDHVEGANSANDVIRAAISEPEKGRESGKKITRLLYSDVEQLRAALQ